MRSFRLKSAAKNLPHLWQRMFGPSSLNTKELEGLVGRFTKIKLLPYIGIKAPFSLGRTIRGVSFVGSYDKDPFASFVWRCSQGDSEGDLVNYLLSLYKEESCMTSAQVVGLPDNSVLSEYPAWALVMPWERTTLEAKYKYYFKAFVENRLDHAASFTESELVSSNDAFYSEANAWSQVVQTKVLAKSIQARGLLELRPLPCIYIMYDGGRWRWFMSGSGNHRAYLANTFGEEKLSAQIKGVINRLDVGKWGNVMNGTYSRVEALHLFDSYFSGDKTRRGVV